MKFSSIEIEDGLMEDLYNVSQMRDRSISELLQDAIEQTVSSFRNGSGKVVLRKAKYLLHGTEAEKMSYVNAGKEPPAKEWVDCYYIKETTMFGDPYRVIVYDGQLIKTPAENVQLI